MPTAIIGMHRSGTSLTARLLSLAGVYLGEERELLPASKDNQKGFWEHERIVKINNRLLALFGGAWDCPPELPHNWLAIAEQEGLRQEARQCLADALTRHSVWGWKDPRTTLLLPFWRQAVADVTEEPLRFVICIRGPLDVAASLNAREPLPLRPASALWQFYTAQALLGTDPAERIVLFYDHLLAHPRQTMAPALSFLGLPPVLENDSTERAWRAFVDKGLRHHQHPAEETLNSPVLPDSAQQLYAALLSGPNAVTSFLERYQREEQESVLRAHLRANALDKEVRLLHKILNSPAHRFVETMNKRIRSVPLLRRAAALGMGLAAGSVFRHAQS